MITRRRFMKNETSLNYIKLFPVDYYDYRLNPASFGIDTFLCEEVRNAYKDILYDQEEESITILLPSNFTILIPFLQPRVEDGEQYWYADLFKGIELSEGFTEISEGAIDDWEYLRTIIVPSTITSINCNNYNIYNKHVYINNLETWCNIDFNEKPNPAANGGTLYLNYTKIEELIIPENIDTISPYAFYGITHITSLNILGTNTQFDENTFKNCEGITQIDSYSSIPNSGFYSNVNLEKIILHDSVTSIGEGAFYGCRSLTNVEIPDGVISIGESAFWNCTSLTSVSIGGSVTSIGSNAFYNCKNLYKVISRSLYPTWNLSSDGRYFQKTREGFKIYVPVNCKNVYINNNPYFSEHSDWIIEGFDGEEQLCPYNDQIWYSNSTDYIIKNYEYPLIVIDTSITAEFKQNIKIWLPDSVETIDTSAFKGHTILENIILPNSITTINNDAFAYCSNITNITLPNKLITIGSGAFGACEKLKSIGIPQSVTSIGDQAFFACSNLASVSIGNVMGTSSLTSIGHTAFKSCKLSTIRIPSKVTFIGYEAFSNNTNLTKVICKNLSPSNVSFNTNGKWNAFGSNTSLTITVPKLSFGYTTAEGWKEYVDKIITSSI